MVIPFDLLEQSSSNRKIKDHSDVAHPVIGRSIYFDLNFNFNFSLTGRLEKLLNIQGHFV